MLPLRVRVRWRVSFFLILTPSSEDAVRFPLPPVFLATNFTVSENCSLKSFDADEYCIFLAITDRTSDAPRVNLVSSPSVKMFPDNLSDHLVLFCFSADL